MRSAWGGSGEQDDNQLKKKKKTEHLAGQRGVGKLKDIIVYQ